jgi:predicted Rossmann fold flavoprotein
MKKDVIIIGGGAAGVFCAIQAGRRGRSTLVLERADKIGNKVLISGGGRCNFTNLHTTPANFICGNPHFHKSALARFTPHDFLALVERHGIRCHEKKSGQMFCDGSAREIISMLEKESADVAVDFLLNCQVHRVERQDRFFLETDRGSLECHSLVVATGGLSLPKLGATDFGHRLAAQFGLRVTPTKPALVPLTLSPLERSLFSPLSGISVDALVRLRDRQFRENFLVTRQGLSGPAILQISSYWNPQESIVIDLLPDLNAVDLLAKERERGRELKTVLSRYWPQRFARAWTEAYADSRPLREYSNRELQEIARRLHHWEILPVGTAGYDKAEVTAGGVDTAELYSKTMEARRVSGLYFVGEVVDVTGQLGGFNLHWAWASGYAAGQAV